MSLPDWWKPGTALTFAHPWFLLLLLLVPLLAYLQGRRGPSSAVTFSSTATLRKIGKASVSRAGKLLRSLLLGALALCSVGIARPQLANSHTQVEASGIDIMIVLDVSFSMLTKDFEIGGDRVTRLDAIREITRRFIDARPNDRIGIVAFGAQPYVVSPMTLDHEWLDTNLDRIRIGMVEGSTAIGSAMATAGSRLNDKHAKSRVMVLLTDGENNAGKIPPTTAAEALKALKVHFYAIGVGINGVAPVALQDGRGNLLTDALGNYVYQNQRVHFDEAALRDIAHIAEGKFFRATDTQSLESIYHDIDSMEKTTVNVKKYQDLRELFPACIIAGLVLLTTHALLGQTIWKRLP